MRQLRSATVKADGERRGSPMHRYLLSILLLAVATCAWAQDSDPDDQAESRPSQEAQESAADEQDDDSDLDDESYRDVEEEDFVPTEDIPADQAIPFPTDI
jgi:hypothetical protein